MLVCLYVAPCVGRAARCLNHPGKQNVREDTRVVLANARILEAARPMFYGARLKLGPPRGFPDGRVREQNPAAQSCRKRRLWL
jgi:hypothetical protein